VAESREKRMRVRWGLDRALDGTLLKAGRFG
jgi:hypothetical protein